METSKLINGDCLEELKKLDEDSVDLLCTDPPYGYGFMGKHWDTFQEKKSTKSQKVGWMSPGMTKSTYGMKEFFVPIWEEALRVVKPGGFAFVMSAPRSDVQMVMVQTLQESGFDVSFSPIYWTYATGFPKALNIGKAVDKRLNKKREVIGVKKRGYVEEAKKRGTTFTQAEANQNNKDIFGYGEEEITSGPASDEAKKLDGSYAGYQPKPAVEVVIVAMKPLDKKMGYVDQALDNGKGVTWLDDCRIPFQGMNDFPGWWKTGAKGSKGYLETDTFKIRDMDSEEIMIRQFGGKENYEKWKKQNVKMSEDEEHYIKAKGDKENYSEERGWDKWGEEDFGETRNAQNFTTEDTYERVSAFGDTEQSETKDGRNLWGKKATKKVKITKRKPREEDTVFKTSGFKSEENDTAEASPLGRFAANLLVSDDILNDGIHRKSKHNPNPSAALDGNTWGGTIQTNRGPRGFDDEGSFSRYYSLDAWWEDRVKKLPEEIQRTFPFLIVPKASKSEKNSGLENNIHPTVKPLNLMSYLVTLGSRKNDVVLDPFMGSGTTPMACVTLSRNYIGIEREDEYFKIAQARVNKLENPIKQWEQWM